MHPLAFGGAILLLWLVFQLISFIWCKISRMRKRTQIQECLAEIEAADRQIWAAGILGWEDNNVLCSRNLWMTPFFQIIYKI